MREPAFWARDGWLPALLSPLGSLYAAATARRLGRPGWQAPVPVICCGGVTAGGAGKTPLALDLAGRLLARGQRPVFLTRGHRGRARGVVRVDPAAHDAEQVGDEALLLAAVAPTFVSADRAASARIAAGEGAGVLVMDDGLQNPTLCKTLSFLVIDGGGGFGNGRAIPAGPLREPVASAAARCQAAVLVGPDVGGAATALPSTLPLLRARLAPVEADRFADRRVIAFAGIGRPEKFFETVREAGCVAVASHPFADHHRYREGELDRLLRDADTAGAILLTTAKDAVRLPANIRARVQVLTARLVWDDERAIEALLDRLC